MIMVGHVMLLVFYALVDHQLYKNRKLTVERPLTQNHHHLNKITSSVSSFR